jgi:hypothetical protein
MAWRVLCKILCKYAIQGVTMDIHDKDILNKLEGVTKRARPTKMTFTVKLPQSPKVPLSYGRGSKGARPPVKSIIEALRTRDDKLSHQAANLIESLLTENAKLRGDTYGL